MSQAASTGVRRRRGAADVIPHRNQDVPAHGGLHQTGARVLVVDDEPYIVDSLSLGLQRHGYAVRGAADGHEAL